MITFDEDLWKVNFCCVFGSFKEYAKGTNRFFQIYYIRYINILEI